MSSEERPITVVGAIVANLVIAVAKFVAAAFSGSSAMMAEGFHSVIDTGNEALMLVGIKRSNKGADAAHPFGYGKELYFWTLIVAVLLFGVGGGLSIYEGIRHLQHPGEGGKVIWSYVVLGVALVAEGTSWTIAVRAVHKEERGRSFLRKLQHSKDPSKFVVVAEDSAALVGILVAAAGVYLTERLKSPWPDAIASMTIGAILCSVAIYLIVQSKHLLVGESADAEMVDRIQELVAGHSAVEDVRRPLTMHFGPEDVMCNLDIKFDSGLSADELARAIDEIELCIRREYPEVERIYVEAQLFNGDSKKRNERTEELRSRPRGEPAAESEPAE